MSYTSFNWWLCTSIDAAKKYHEYLVRQQKLGDEEKQRATKNNRIIQRQRVRPIDDYIASY